jgi:hypothetical protein
LAAEAFSPQKSRIKEISIIDQEEPIKTQALDVNLEKIAMVLPINPGKQSWKRDDLGLEKEQILKQKLETNKALIRRNALDISRILFCVSQKDLERDPELRAACLKLLN